MTAVHGLDRVTFVATKTVRADDHPIWEQWLADHAAAHGGALWRLLDPGPSGRPEIGHTHVVQLPGDVASRFDAATAVARADGSARGHAEIRRGEWIRVGDGIALAAGADVTGLIVAEVVCVDPTRVDEWDAWYDEQHLPDMMASGAFVAGTRWRRTDPRPGTANHLTVYEIADRSVGDAIDRSAAAMAPLVARGRKHECHTGGLTWALEAA